MPTKIIRKNPDIANANNLENIPEILRKIFINRGVFNVDDLEKSLSHLLPYHQLLNIDKAVTLLFEMLSQQKNILIIGDFDADGATSTAVAMSALKMFGAKNIHYLVPNRFEYGYGLTPEIVAAAEKYSPDLIITVDNGISSIAGVAYAKEKNIKVLITDHHLAGKELPQADVIINPDQPGDLFPSKNLAGVGVIFYVMLAFRSHLREQDWFKKNNLAEPNMSELLDIVALGTVADVVPLDKNNRILVHQGLLRIRAGQCRAGIKALLQIGNREIKNVVASDLAFAVGPRLNAAGRLDDMSLGISCLLSEDLKKALEQAQILDELNQERKFIEQDMQAQALQAIQKLKLDDSKNLPFGLCLFDEEWHQGVIGILAGRMKDKFHRPTIAFAVANDLEIKGSARSIEGIHIKDILENIVAKYPDLILKFGGHAMAAGLTLLKSNFKKFAKIFDDEIKLHIDEKHLQHAILSDGELSEHELNLETAELLRQYGPWGQAFPEPIFDGQFELVEQRIVGGRHLKMTLKHQQKYLDAIAFNINIERWPNERVQRINIAYKLDVNEFRGMRNLQLLVEHLEEI